MPASTKKEEDTIIADELVIERAPAITPDPTGFYADADWIRVECDWPKLQPRDGFGKLWAEIDASLTFHEALAIPLEAAGRCLVCSIRACVRDAPGSVT